MEESGILESKFLLKLAMNFAEIWYGVCAWKVFESIPFAIACYFGLLAGEAVVLLAALGISLDSSRDSIAEAFDARFEKTMLCRASICIGAFLALIVA